MKNNRKNKRWMRSRDQLKRPKVFNVQMIRMPNGSFHLLGGGSQVFIQKNQYRVDACQVDVRDLAVELNNSKITSL